MSEGSRGPSKMRIFLTGAGGYVGLHILRELLDHGHQVTAVVRSIRKLGPFAQDPKLRIVEADLEDHGRIVQELVGQEVCIHAALIWGDPGSEFEVRDAAVAAKLFNAAAKSGLKRCIYISSVAVHRPFSALMSEEDPLSATDMYGATKAAGELFLRAACAEHQMAGIVVRPGPVVGPPAFPGASFRSDERITQMVAAALQGRPLEVRSGDGRQFSDVSMLARVACLLTRVENPDPTYICVDRRIITWEQLARLVLSCLNSPSEIHVLEHCRQDPSPQFRTERLERLYGERIDADNALSAHIRYLALTLSGQNLDEQC